MLKDGRIIFAVEGNEEVSLLPKMANRHGMIAGATGTGKTVTLKTLAEGFSEAGVPVFMADIKGDLSGTSTTFPVSFWDVYGEKGLPLRTTVSEIGPVLLGNILGLTDIQADVLTVVFKIADDNGLLLLDTKDLKSMLNFVADNAADYEMEYGKMSKQSLSAIVRAIVALEAEGAEFFFGEPALDIADWLKTDVNGKGEIALLDCQKLINNPKMYSAFLMWLLSELFERLPEVGDLDRPKMVFFFDEAHLLFNNASKFLLEKIEQMVKLIRSKGVGVFFVTQNPKDIPDGVLAQLGCKIQHALRAYTPAEQKGVKAAANAFRVNPEFDTYQTILDLGVGEALVSTLDESGVPTVVKKVKINLPESMLGPVDENERTKKINASLLYTKYKEMIDRESAYEILTAKVAKEAELAENEKQAALAEKEAAKQAAREEKEAEKKKAQAGKAVKRAVKSTATTTAGTIGRQLGKSMAKGSGSFGKTLGGNVGASIARGLIGTLFK
ncbi:MAG: DUF853 domain-containing protein [Lachnospiraceae bacterium]|nr:DUF853 domain-containing protein [Lachnospiraceae bacterium]